MSDLRSILTQHYQERGELSPRSLVAAAAADGHPLHHRFEWDNEKAGEQYRLIQAAEMIRSVKIKYRDNDGGKPNRVRAFISVGETAYKPTEEVMADPLLSRLALRDAERDLIALKVKYAALEGFRDLALRIIGAGQEEVMAA